MRLAITMTVVLLLPAAATAQDTVYFAHSRSVGSANPFIGIYHNGAFNARQHSAIAVATAAAAFQAGAEYVGLNPGGTNMRLTVEDIHEPSGDLAETLIVLREQGDRIEPILLHTPGIAIEAVPTRLTQDYTPAQVDRIHALADSLYRDALAELAPTDWPDSVVFGRPVGRLVDRAQYPAAVTVPAILYYGSQVDDRALVFLLMDEGRLVLGRFGHPEWSPHAERVVTVLPIIYFRIAGDPEVYVYAKHSYAWEDDTHAILNARSGKTLLESYW